MVTFEKAYKDVFKNQLIQFTDKTITVSNDINYKPLEKDPDALVVIIKTGPGTKRNSATNDLTSVTFNINFIVNANDIQKILGALNSLIWNYNAVWSTVDIPVYDIATKELNTKTFTYYPTFTTPFLLGSVYDLKTANETIKAATLMMSATISYSSNASTEPEIYKLWINDTEYILNFERIESVSAPAYEYNPINTEPFLQPIFLNNVITFNFVILKAKGGIDALHDLLHEEYFSNNLLSGNTLKLTQGATTINIKTYTLSEVYENGITVINLTLTR